MVPAFLLGPTASGKHEAALLVAAKLGAEIVSVDSMKVYRRMDIGTAKPTPAMLARVRHHLVDICDPAESYNAGRFVRDARAAAADIASRGKRALFVGGTSLYYKAYVYGLFEGPAADPALRAELLAEDPEALHAELRRVDPAAAARIHPNDSKRLVRAIEVWRLTGVPISARQTHFARPSIEAPVVILRRDGLADRIARRVRRMFQQGLVEEVRGLLTAPWGREGRRAVGYREVVDHLEGRSTAAEAEALIVRDTNRFARRQAQWFRGFKEGVWEDADDDPAVTSGRILRRLDAPAARP